MQVPGVPSERLQRPLGLARVWGRRGRRRRRRMEKKEERWWVEGEVEGDIVGGMGQSVGRWTGVIYHGCWKT